MTYIAMLSGSIGIQYFVRRYYSWHVTIQANGVT